ncbi:MAG: 50S ribosomal protein L18e [Candidatus Pacearchaeota archaeon]
MKMISKTEIEKKASKKTNKELAKAINIIKKSNIEIAAILAYPRRKRVELNLDYIDKHTKEGEKIIVPGKVLSEGSLTKKIKIVAWKFSEKSLEKIKKTKSEAVLITEEIKKNPELKELRLLK